MKYWPHLFLLGALISGIYGFAGLGTTPEQIKIAQILFYVCAVIFVPLFVWRFFSFFRGK